MKIDNSLIDSLLYGEEGVDLDFKRDQYIFTKASVDEKSELLKDILAFANAWRRSDAFILVGVKEVQGGRSEIYGIDEKIDDSQIQQFVNSKTQKPIIFSYRNIEFEGEGIGIIHIPVQKRPFYLKKDFGPIKKETVYIRRGSSTDIAKIDEIAKMGSSSVYLEENHPKLELFYADYENRNLIIEDFSIESLVLHSPSRKEIPDYERSSSNSWELGLYQSNRDYYRELIYYTAIVALLTPINFAIQNHGSVVANDVRVEIDISDPQNIFRAMDEYEMPDIPELSYSIHNRVALQIQNQRTSYDLTVERVSDHWLINASAKKVQPKSIAWIEGRLFLGAIDSAELKLETTIYADNLPEPIKKEFLITTKSDHRAVSLDDIIEIERERFIKSDKYKRFLEEHPNNNEGEIT